MSDLEDQKPGVSRRTVAKAMAWSVPAVALAVPAPAYAASPGIVTLDGTEPTWRTDFLTEGWPNNRPWATVREGQWKYTEIPVTPGAPETGDPGEFERELYDLVNDPYELQNVATDPQHATRITSMRLRLRQLRPFWPVDSDPNGPDPDEDE